MNQKKIILIALLSLILIIIMVYNSLQNENKNSQTNSYTFENYIKYNNTEVIFNAYIKEINKTNQILKAYLGDPPYSLITIKTNNNINNLHKGDTIFVIGVLNGKNYVTAKKIFIREQWSDEIIIFTSILAIPYTLYLFFRTWKFNRKTLTFERRRKDA